VPTVSRRPYRAQTKDVSRAVSSTSSTSSSRRDAVGWVNSKPARVGQKYAAVDTGTRLMGRWHTNSFRLMAEPRVAAEFAIVGAARAIYVRTTRRTVTVLCVLAVLTAGCVGGIASHHVPVTLPSAATLTADLYLPRGTGPFPALILLHGCSGIRPNTLAWAHWLQSEGYAAFVLDSFTARGLQRLCGDSSPLPGAPRSNDVFAAAAYLARLSVIDRTRIGAIGWSHGGWTVLWAGAYESRYPDVQLQALVAFYPFCGDTVSYRGSAPLLMLLGEKDDWTPAEPCRQIAEIGRQQGRDVSAVVYGGAHHGFDSAHIVRPTRVADARRGRGATVAYDPQAHGDSEKRLREFLERHLKR
jgi:dienelactone hydrolase